MERGPAAKFSGSWQLTVKHCLGGYDESMDNETPSLVCDTTNLFAVRVTFRRMTVSWANSRAFSCARHAPDPLFIRKASKSDNCRYQARVLQFLSIPLVTSPSHTVFTAFANMYK